MGLKSQFLSQKLENSGLWGHSPQKEEPKSGSQGGFGCEPNQTYPPSVSQSRRAAKALTKSRSDKESGEMCKIQLHWGLFICNQATFTILDSQVKHSHNFWGHRTGGCRAGKEMWAGWRQMCAFRRPWENIPNRNRRAQECRADLLTNFTSAQGLTGFFISWWPYVRSPTQPPLLYRSRFPFY
jgi:hypothetical protein